MRVLAFDTSTEFLSLALRLGNAELVREIHAVQQHSQLLVPEIQALLAEAGLSLGALDGIAFGAGPGAFTGLRIACAVAQGLAFGADLPVTGVSTLMALAEQAGGTRVVACLDARMGEVYHAAYEKDSDGWREMQAPGLYRPEDVPMLNGIDWIGVGSGFAAMGDALRERFGGALCACQPALFPHAREMARLGGAVFARGAGLPAWEAAPVYIRERVALKTAER